ncbi:MAG TPA: hypothetical protein VK901_08840 [Nitrospiraceae bacterium]|nr:hypothetical protein [Nitrospiraceae bacterium]
MEIQQKESYTEPVLIAHELLRDVTGQKYREKTSDKPGDGI